MKTQLLFFATLFAILFKTNAQVNSADVKNIGQASPLLKTMSSQTTVVTDVLHYYFNKYYFKTATTNLSNFPYYKSPAATSTAISHCGSKFEVPAGETVTITGLEAYASMPPAMSHASPYIQVNLFLCDLDNNCMPKLPAIDSVITGVGVGAVSSPSLIGGNFVGGTVRTMTNNFAVLYRDMSTVSGDTVFLLRTAGATATNSAASPAQRCSDGFGFIRYLSKFYSTADFTAYAGFGIGTDYEFAVAPRVTYTIQASQIISAEVLNSTTDTLCTRTEMTFTNTSSAFYEHRMYNLNQFYRKWNLYSQFLISPPGGFSADSSITWNFEFYDGGHHSDSRVFLPYVNNHTISAVTDSSLFPNCFTANEFRARLRPMDAMGLTPQFIYNENFTVCMKFCNGDAVGLKNAGALSDMKIYPNPVINEKITLSGLEGKNTIRLYTLLGQLVTTDLVEKESFTINLSNYPPGTYLLKITSSNHSIRVSKIIKAD